MDNIDRRGILSRIVALGVAPQLQKSFLAASILFAFTGDGHAQSLNTVTLTYDNGDRISGEFVELVQGAIRLQTLMGAVTVPLAEVSCDGAACPSGATAQSPLILTALDGSFEIVGNLTGISDNQYVVATELGEMRVDIDQAECTGIGCVIEIAKPVFGGDVSLTDGNIVIEGRLVDMEDKAYVVDVETMGRVRISSDVFQCIGVSCP